MNMTRRIVLAVAVVLVDTIIFFLPATAILLAYILIVNPPWFRSFINRLDDPC